MKKTRLCDILQIQYPIIQAPMAWVATAELVGAVSKAGGLGTLGPNAGMVDQVEAGDINQSELRLREQIRKVRFLTNKPFAVNLNVGWGDQRIISDRLVEVALDEKIEIAVVSMGSSKAYTRILKEKGVKVIHAVASVEHALKAEADGVDAVVCEGYEGGGHLGNAELTTLVLVPQIADAVKIPVIAGGGIADGRGMAAALALGAGGVYVGTRFLATTECVVHPNAKQAIVKASDTSTVAFARKTGIFRCLKNKYTEKHMEMENQGASFEQLRDFERTGEALGGWHRLPGALLAGNIEEGSLALGAISGLIKDISSAEEVIKRMIGQYDTVVQGL